MSYKSFAVAGGLGGGKPGSANIGNLIVKNLIKVPGVHVKVLARPESVKSPAAKELTDLGVTVVPVDYSDQAKLVAELKDTDVLISTLTTAAVSVQQTLIDAVATGKTGVKLFVPSEFGNDTTKVKDEESPLFAKRKVQLDLEKKKIPYAVFITGPFADWVGTFAGPDKDGKIKIVGSGDEKVSFTAINDAARFIAHVLTETPPSSLSNAVFRIQGSTATLNNLAALYQSKSPKQIEVSHESPETALQRFREKGADEFVSFLKSDWALGNGLVGEPLSNSLWDEWLPKDVREFIEEF